MANLQFLLKILSMLLKKLSKSSEKKQSSTPVNQPSQTEKPSLSFSFNATIKGKESNGTLSIGGKSWPAISGRWGNGYLPEGRYIAYGFNEESGDAYTFKDENGRKVGFYIRLEPQFKTDRTQLLIHPDGNIEGTLGCIGLKYSGYLEALDSSFFLKDIMLKEGKVPLEVKYS